LQRSKNFQAIELLTENEKYAKGNGEYYALLAVTQQNAKEYSLALASYQKALKTDNTVSRWWFGMAVVLEYLNNWSDAQLSYTQALDTGQLPEELMAYARQRLDYVVSQIELSAIL
jgi:Tfp pilus assembly protein PilF